MRTPKYPQLAPFCVALALSVICTSALTGCSSITRGTESDATASLNDQQVAAPSAVEVEQQQVIQRLKSRIDALESHLTRVDTKLDSVTVRRFDAIKERAQSVSSAPAEGVGTRVEPKAAEGDPDAGFVNDEAVSAYRQSMVDFHAGRYSESILGFASFLQRFADHPLAGSAQFHVGESYFREKEYALALQEFQRVLTSYDRSPHISDALREMAFAADGLGRPEEAAGYRQQLMSMFPQSPAAAGASEAPRSDNHDDAPPLPTSTLDAIPASPQTSHTESEPSKFIEAGIDRAPPTAPLDERTPASEDIE